jgi:O-antigen ligase
VALAAARVTGRLDRRRGLVIGGMVAVVLLGSVFMRSSALGSFARFAGIGHENANGHVESYSHRWVLDYIGYRIFLEHPVTGAGWQSGLDEATYGPVLPAARKRFPSQPAEAFPSPAHPWGIQSAYVEVLAELGLVGAALFVAWVATGVAAGARPFLGRDGPSAPWPRLLGLLWLCVVLGAWNGLWFIAGIPFDAVIWLAFGLAAAPLLQPPVRAS